MDTLSKLEQETSDQVTPFGAYEEEAIISLALDHPEFWTSVGRFLKPNMFGRLECRLVAAEILNSFEKFDIIPTRKILRDRIIASLTEDHPYDEILRIVDRKSDYREVPLIKDTLLKWAKDRAFGQIYSEEAQLAYARGDYQYLEKIISEANRIADVSSNGFWFFDNYQLLFEPNVIDHRTTGFPKLDKLLNNGGPSPKEVVCFLAPTNVGKSILLCNTAISSLKGMGPRGIPGQDVLLITCELDTIKTAMRCLGVMAQDIPMEKIPERKDYITRIVNQIQNTYNKRFLIVEWPPEECSVNNIYALLDSLKRTDGWHPDVIIIDYLDLLISRNSSNNTDDYSRQKSVSSEIRGLAINENVLIFTATQTNRTAVSGEDVADMSKAAESFGKQFSLDYVISLNQTRNERSATPPRMRMYIAKNRNGPKNEIIDCTITYETMVVREQP
jgi:replicative DNA helicase